MLFTEDQWRAIVIVEQASEQRFNYFYGAPVPAKRIYGPTFSDGEYFLECEPQRIAPYSRSGGPMPAKFRVFEAESGLTITRPASDRAVALSAARARIRLIGEHWPVMLSKEKARMAVHRANRAAEKSLRTAAARKPRKITKRARAVFDASGGKCHYCGTPLVIDGKWHIEHKMPRALFGGSEQSNLVAACAPCNHAKRDKTDLEFIAHIEKAVT